MDILLACFLQVILVQVNPGEAFTIQRDDGQIQCITGPAQVPMMSPNGSVPQIYVPPGYVQQIIEENGVRRVLVLPQTEFHPGGHSPLHHPPPPPPHAHLQAFIPHPHIMHPHPHLYSGMAGGTGDMNPQYISQYHPAHTTIYSEQGQFTHTHAHTHTLLLYQRQGQNAVPLPNLQGKNIGLYFMYVLCVFRVQAMCNCLQGVPSEPVSFTTLSCEPDRPSPPRKASGTKSSLVLQWKAPCDNGSKIQNYILQWDEGKGTDAFEQCYYGPQKQYRLTKLSTASRYYFRLAAKNDMGVSEFSEVVHIMTSCSVPAPPLSPELIQSGVTWLCVRWHRPAGSPKEDEISYVLEMEEEGSGYGFQASYDGDELSHTVRNLHRSTTYRFRVIAYNAEGKSIPSGVSEFTTAPDRPGCPCRLAVKGKPHPTSFRLTWDPPKDNGGSDVTKYVAELSEGLSGMFQLSFWCVYSGSAMECVCDDLSPGCSYQARVHCISAGGESQVCLTEPLQVQTPPVPPGPCQPPRVVGKPKAREVQLRWAPPLVDGGSAVSLYSVEMFAPQVDEGWEVYQGSELDCTVGSLLPGRTYGFRLRAANKAGYGPFSERSEVTTGPGAPEACRPPHVTCKSPTCAVISWESPPCNGAAVSEYRLEWGAAEGSMQMCYTGAALSHEMRGLLPATNYFCRVQAVNVAGVGPFSDAVLCQTPCSVPAPVSKRDEDEDEEDEEARPLLYSPSTCLGLRWEAPCDHGSEITSYQIDLGERQPILTGPVTKYIIQNLQPDTTYRIRIQALNSLGAGPFSHTFKLKTKPLPPLPPRLECTASSHQTLRLKWGDGPAKAQPTDSLQYHLQMEDKNGRFISLYKGPCHTHKVQRLNESTSYVFRIQAFNEAGEGPFSTVYTFTTPLSPPAPLKAPRVERVDESCEVSWETLPPMKGDPVIYCLQSMQGNSEFKQIYKGSATSYQLPNLSSSTEYRFRVCAIRQCQDAPEIIGPYSSTVILLPPRVDTPGVSGATGSKAAEAQKPKRSLTDEQFSFLIIALLAVTSILIAVAIQYFVIE
uniref:Fibronectin type-III domain-containing protein 3A n=1 Tax=Cyprinus carpio TaxID=7962 RepID=A0A8C2AMY5_CYPCA